LHPQSRRAQNVRQARFRTEWQALCAQSVHLAKEVQVWARSAKKRHVLLALVESMLGLAQPPAPTVLQGKLELGRGR